MEVVDNFIREQDYICCLHRVNVQTNKLCQIFCGDFGKKFPWFIESPLSQARGHLINRGNFIPEVPLKYPT